MRYILHYTEPGDVVFDGFCGTGMTGVAAQLCGDRSVLQSLGYNVNQKAFVRNSSGETIARMGARRAILQDISTIATFISSNYISSKPSDAIEFEREANRILKEIEGKHGHLFCLHL